MPTARSKRTKTAAATPVAKPRSRTKKKAARRIEPLDFSAFPPEAVAQAEKWICLACVLDVFTRHMGLPPTAAYLQVKRYTPSVAELNATTVTRPYFVARAPGEPCPYCGSAAKWHARVSAYRIESGKATDGLRRELVKSLPKSGDQFVVLEEKATQQQAFFQWLEKLSEGLALEDPGWLREISQRYLSRKEPKVDWQAAFEQSHSIRRSRRLESGWEVDTGRLFLAPVLFDELLLVQYLVSRSHLAGGLTFEGRYTLPELFARLRNAGYLRAVGVHAQSPSDAFEELINYLGGGEASLRFYYIVDRREFLELVKALKGLRVPKARAQGG